MAHSLRIAHVPLLFNTTLGGLLALFVTTTFVVQASAQIYPSRTIRVIVPFLAGSATDVTARLLTERLADYLGANIVVENKPGASGNLRADAVAKADP